MLARARHDTDALDGLTPRQGEVLALIAEGRSNAAIARRLVITEKAVVQACLPHPRPARAGRERRRSPARARGRALPDAGVDVSGAQAGREATGCVAG